MNTADEILDTHCHLGRYERPVAVLEAARSSCVGVVAVTEDPGEYRLLRTRLGRRTGLDVALGLHPLKAATFTPGDLARFFRLLPETRWIGEVGLDFSRAGVATKRQQLKVFETVLTEAEPGRHPLTVHSRGAEATVIELLASARCRAVLHWYSGPFDLVEKALAAGLYFSLNPVMMRSKRISGLLRLLPRERVLLETDGPFAKLGGGPAHPSGLNGAVRQLADEWDLSELEAKRTIIANQRRVVEG